MLGYQDYENKKNIILMFFHLKQNAVSNMKTNMILSN